MRTLPSALLASALILPAPLAAQYIGPYGVVSGIQVRVSAPRLSDDAIGGRLLAFGGDSLLLDMSGGRARIRIPTREVRRVETAMGKDRAGWALRGAAVGLLAGGVAGATISDNSLERMVGSFVGAGMGLVLGTGIGAAAAPTIMRTVWTSPTAADGGSSPGEGYALAIPAGTDVRVRAEGLAERQRGRVEQVAGDTLVYATGGGVRHVPLATLASLEIRGGKDRQRGAAIGAIALGLVTGVAAATDYSHGNISGGDAIGSTLGNIGVGALLGAWLAPQGWLRVPLPRR